MQSHEKLARLNSKIQDFGSLLVAYSGGADSAFLANAVHKILGEKMLAVIADSPSLPRAELAAAIAFAEKHGIPLKILQTRELENSNYAKNDAQRCYFCKDELFQQMDAVRVELGFTHVAYGMNLDDRGDHRPGGRAANEHNVVAPLVLAELTKNDVRELAQQSGLEIWNKPASACLASRIEYGRAVTTETLLQVERAEDALHQLGFSQVRVRHHGEQARIEIAREEMPRALNMEMFAKIHESLQLLGFKHISLDMQGYRSGSMNTTLPQSKVLPLSAIGKP